MFKAGTFKLVGTDPGTVKSTMSELLNDEKLYSEMANARNPYGTEKPLPELYKLLNIILLWEMLLRNFMREMKLKKKTDKLSRWLLILIVFEVLLFLYCLFFAKEILIEEGLFLITGLFAAIVLS